MELKTDDPGWIEYTPDEKHPDIKCKVKRLSFREARSMAQDIREGALLIKGKVKDADTGEVTDGLVWHLFGDKAEELFKLHVKDIEGIVVNGMPLKRPEDLLDPTVGNHPLLSSFYAAVLSHFFDINIIAEDEEKN